MNQTKNILKIIIISAINIALSYGLFAQHPQYSVQLIVNLVPPYSINTVDYVSGDNEKLTVLLTNTDLAKPYLTIRLRMQVKCNNQVILQSKPYGNYPPIQLQSGIPTKISLQDLAPYFNTDNLDIQGMDVSRFLRSKTLPEGMYQFCFEAIEYYTGQVVGRSSCAMAPLLLAEPPLLNLPFNNKVLFSREPQHIIFQWTPRHLSVPSLAFNSEYVFSLHELYDNGLSVEAAFNNTPALYEEVLKPSTLLYGPDKPLLMEGKRYAWRVQARRDIPGEESLIRNNGYSQIYGFTYQSACQPPENVQATPTHNKAAITWNPNPIMHAENAEGNYMVEYREKTMDNAGADNYSGQASWYNTPGDNYRATLYNLKPGKTYQYRVAMRCPLTNGYAYSDVRELVTEKQPVNPENLSCGRLIPKQDITNRQSLPQLSAGETFYAADFPVTVKEVTQNGENYTGKGWVTIPVLEYGLFKAVAEFDNIKINTDRQLIAGFVKTTYDETGKNMVDLKYIDILANDLFGVQISNPNNADTTIDDNYVNNTQNNIQSNIQSNNNNALPNQSQTTRPIDTDSTSVNQNNTTTTNNSDNANVTNPIVNLNNDSKSNNSNTNTNINQNSSNSTTKAFTLTELTATDILNKNRVAKSNETLYYVIGKTKRNTGFNITYSPKISIKEIPKDKINWKWNDNNYTEAQGKNKFQTVIKSNDNAIVSVTTGHPKQNSEKVEIKWVNESRKKIDIVSKLSPILSVFNEINYWTKNFKTVGIPCNISVLDDIKKSIEKNQMAVSYNTYNQEEKSNRLYNKVQEFEFSATGMEILKLSCGKEIKITIPGTSYKIDIASANIELSAGLEGSISIKREEAIETNKVSWINSKVSGGGYIIPSLSASLLGVKGVAELKAGLKFEYPLEGNFSVVGFIFYSDDFVGKVVISKDASIFVTRDFSYEVFRLPTAGDFIVYRLDINKLLK